MPSKPGERKRRPLEWNEKQLHALAAVFEGRSSREKIAQDCTIPLRTLKDWIAHPDFQAKLKEMRERMLDTFDELGVAYVRKEQRLMALSALAVSARAEYEQRPWLREYRPVLVKRPNEDPGARAGSMLMVEDYIVTERYNAEAASAERAALADIAAELGERVKRSEVTGKDGAPIEFSCEWGAGTPEESEETES